jgi:hypothetical protein
MISTWQEFQASMDTATENGSLVCPDKYFINGESVWFQPKYGISIGVPSPQLRLKASDSFIVRYGPAIDQSLY